MVRVGSSKPHLRWVEDRWGQIVPGYRYVDGYGITCEHQWQQIEHFQAPFSEPESWEDQEMYKARLKLLMEHRMKLSGNQYCWQMDLFTPDFGGYIRFTVFLNGNLKLVRWTWADAWIRYPALKAISWIWNRLVTLWGSSAGRAGAR